MRATRAPIALQLVGLLLTCLLAAQAAVVSVVILTPPPQPSIYRLSEVAEALKGGSLTPRLGRELVRRTGVGAPELAKTDGPREQRGRHELAMLLGADERDVILVEHRGPRWPFLLLGGRGAFARGPGSGGPGPGPPPDGSLGPGEYRRMEPTIFGRFTAAAKAPSGGWTVVTPLREPFPNEWQRRIFLWLLASLAVVTPAGYLFARRITAPLDRFAQAAESLGRDPHAPLMNLTGPAEVGAAARAFNEMQARIKRYVDDRTAMVGAISHDLRTPLARIRFKVEKAPPQVKAAVLADVAQMETMISGVLAFIRDASEAGVREPLDLLSLIECVVDDAALVGRDVRIVQEGSAFVQGDASALQRLFENLVDNAVKYGKAARVRILPDGALVRVEIEDDGPGVPDDELEAVFKPFYRLDRARNLDQGGVGLGLAVARSTARAHGGDVELKRRAGGLTAVVTLPTVSG